MLVFCRDQVWIEKLPLTKDEAAKVKDKAEYVALMNGLKLDNPRLMDIAVPANRACGVRPTEKDPAKTP